MPETLQFWGSHNGDPVFREATPCPRASRFRRFEKILLNSPSWLSLESSDCTISSSNKHTIDFDGLQKFYLDATYDSINGYSPKCAVKFKSDSWSSKCSLIECWPQRPTSFNKRNASSICTRQLYINTRDITATVFSQKASLSPPHMPIICLIRASAYGFILCKCRAICR